VCAVAAELESGELADPRRLAGDGVNHFAVLRLRTTA
jgi:hypothetical protein